MVRPVGVWAGLQDDLVYWHFQLENTARLDVVGFMPPADVSGKGTADVRENRQFHGRDC